MSSTSAETYGVKLNYEGQMRRFPIAAGISFKDLREQVRALLAIPKDADILLKYADEEGDLITISSDLELNSALVPGSLLRLTAIEKKTTGPITYPVLDAPMLDATAPPAQGEDAFRSFGGPQGPHAAPGFAPHDPQFPHPHPPPPPGFGPHGYGPHAGGPGHFGPYRGGLGFRGGCGPHGGRGGWHAHGGRGGFGRRGGFHGAGPYGPRGDMSREEWQMFKKEHKEMHKDLKKDWKEGRRQLKKDWKEGRGFRCADGMPWAWSNPGAQVINLTDDDRLVARFAKDITIPDGTEIAANTPFVKTWRMRNEGAAWPAGCMLRFLGKKSDKMGSSETVPLPVEGAVAPNAEIDVSVNLVAPSKPGRYTGYWKMTTPEGRKFGQRVWASIVVPGSGSSSSSSDSDREADRYEAMVDAVLATGMKAKRHRILRMLQKTKGDVNLVCEKLAKKEEKKARKAMKKQMKI